MEGVVWDSTLAVCCDVTCRDSAFKPAGEFRKISRAKIIGTSIAVVALSSSLTYASSSAMQEREGFFWGAGLGGSYVERTFSTTNRTDDATTRFYMDFFGGYAFNPHIAIGLEAGGWLIESDSDTYNWNPYWPPDNKPSEDPAGEGIMKIFVFTRIYPYRSGNLFIKLGGGYIDHWTKTSWTTIRNEGLGAEVGVGYDIPLSGNWSLTPMISYSYGEAEVLTYDAITASFGFIWHQWKGPTRQFRSVEP